MSVPGGSADVPVAADAQSSYRPALLLVLALVTFMNYTDRMVLPAVAQAIKVEFSLSDTQLGLLNGFAFVALYAVTSLILAPLADRTSRSLVLAGALAFWSLATAACGFAKSLGQLAIARACVGIGESACQPVGYALVGEHFPPEKRNFAISCFIVGNNLGIVAGFALGGWIGATYGWRMAFIALGLPGVLLALALLRFRTPPAIAAATTGAPTSFFGALKLVMRKPLYGYLVLASAAYGMAIFGPVAFLPPFFVRAHGLSMAVVGAASGLAVGFGMAIGTLIGGALGDRLLKRGAEHAQWWSAASVLLAGAAFVATFSLANSTAAFVALFVASIFVALPTPIIAAAIQNECPPAVRATAASIGTLAVSIAGIGLAPLIVGMLSDASTAERGDAESLRHALVVFQFVCIVTALIHLRIGDLFRRSRAANAITAG